MSGAFPAADRALIAPAQNGALPANTAEAFRNERRETPEEIGWTGDCMVEVDGRRRRINGRDKLGFDLIVRAWRCGVKRENLSGNGERTRLACRFPRPR